MQTYKLAKQWKCIILWKNGNYLIFKMLKMTFQTNEKQNKHKAKPSVLNLKIKDEIIN